MCYIWFMERKSKKIFSLDSQPDFEEIDTRLAAGWHVSPHDSGQRKRYLKSLKTEEPVA